MDKSNKKVKLLINKKIVSNKTKILTKIVKDILTIETLNTNQRLEITNLIGQTVYTNIIINKKATI